MSQHRRNRQTAKTGEIAMNQDEFEAALDIVKCKECGQEFNLGAQMYYGPLCPSCKEN